MNEREARVKKHSEVLMAYLSRLPMTELAHIYSCAQSWQNASLNHNSVTQLYWPNEFSSQIRQSVNTITDHDLDILDQTLPKR